MRGPAPSIAGARILQDGSRRRTCTQAAARPAPPPPSATGTRNFTCVDGEVDKSYMIANITDGVHEVRRRRGMRRRRRRALARCTAAGAGAPSKPAPCPALPQGMVYYDEKGDVIVDLVDTENGKPQTLNKHTHLLSLAEPWQPAAQAPAPAPLGASPASAACRRAGAPLPSCSPFLHLRPPRACLPQARPGA